MTVAYPYVYAWGRNPGWVENARARLKGRRCRVLAGPSSMRTVLVEFEDGELVTTSVRALRRVLK